MIVAIHQPQYLPWLGYFDKMIRADAFCYLDNVQYKKNEWQNRNRVKTSRGWQWLTVPVEYRFPQKINEVRINNRVNWRKKHLKSLRMNYGKSPFFREYIGFFEDAYGRDWKYLSELNVHVAEGLRRMLGIFMERTVLASRLKLSEDPTDRLIDICKILGGDTYLSGKDGSRYMDMNRFLERGISVVFQDFSHPEYPQRYGRFQPRLSAVDLLFNCGPDSLNIIREAQ